jgi:hypothetical protein
MQTEIICIFLFLLILVLAPVQRVSFVILPASLLLALFIMSGQSNFYSLSGEIHGPVIQQGISFLVLFVLTRFIALWISRIIFDPFFQQASRTGVTAGNCQKCPLILVQALIFASLLHSEHLWNYLLSFSILSGTDMYEFIRTLSISVLILLLPATASAVIISAVLLILSSVSTPRKHLPLISLLNSLALLGVFYYSLPLLTNGLNELMKGYS